MTSVNLLWALPPLSYYFRRHLASEGIVTLGVCLSAELFISLSTAWRISLGGEGNVLYPVLCSCCIIIITTI